MTLLKHEIRQGGASFGIWTLSIGFLIAVCIFLFPEMSRQIEEANELFSSMGSFSAAFGMDRLSFGTLTGFYAIECCNVLGLGGAFYASLTAAGMLGKEERDRTAEFLLTHPVSRGRIVAEKLAAVLFFITAMNLLIFAVSVCCILAIGETVPLKELALLHAAYGLLQLELGGICFGISAFLKKGAAGVGLGLAAGMYFLNLIANITKSAGFLKYITPFGYCEGADLLADGRMDAAKAAVGIAVGAAGIAAAFVYYRKKDIHG